MSRALLTWRDFKTLPIPQGLIGLWGGTRSAIAGYLVPLGWEIADGTPSTTDPTFTKPNLCSDSFLRSVDTGGSAPGGPTGSWYHGHAIGSHSHSTGYADNYQWRPYPGNNQRVVNYIHTHPLSAAAENFDSQAATPTQAHGVPVVYCAKGTGQGLLTHRDVKESAALPLKLIGIWHSAAAVPEGWAECTGQTSNGVATINLQGYYVRGIPGSGTNPGGTGGAASHNHSTAHHHVMGAGDGTRFNGNDQLDDPEAPPYQGAAYNPAKNGGHRHAISSVSLDTNHATNEQYHQKTRFVTFVGYGSNRADLQAARVRDADIVVNHVLVPRGVVMMWGHPLSEIPSQGWGHCDGGAFTGGNPPGHSAKPGWLDRFVWLTTGDGGTQAGNTGSHTHGPATGHGHSVNNNSDGMNLDGWADSADWNLGSHGHGSSGGAVWTTFTAGSTIPAFKYVAMLVRD